MNNFYSFSLKGGELIEENIWTYNVLGPCDFIREDDEVSIQSTESKSISNESTGSEKNKSEPSHDWFEEYLKNCLTQKLPLVN